MLMGPNWTRKSYYVVWVIFFGLVGCSHSSQVKEVDITSDLRSPAGARTPADLGYRFELKPKFVETLSRDGSAEELYRALNVEEEVRGSVSSKTWSGKLTVTKRGDPKKFIRGKKFVFTVEPVVLTREDLLELSKALNVRAHSTHYQEGSCSATLYRLGRFNIATAEQEKGQICDPSLQTSGMDLAIAWHSSAYPSGADFSFYLKQRNEFVYKNESGSIQFSVELDGESLVKGSLSMDGVIESVVFKEKGESVYYSEDGYLIRPESSGSKVLKVFKVSEEHWPSIKARLSRSSGKIYFDQELITEIGEIKPTQ